MNTDLYRKLMAWRNEQAKREGVETYRVFPNATLEAIATALPKNKEEMTCIKGLKDAKFSRYGAMILHLIKENTSEVDGEIIGSLKSEIEDISNIQYPVSDIESSASDEPLSVSQFLDALNLGLSGMAARLKGEVSSVDIRERVVYFSLKDSQDESLINCLIFRSHYQLSGVSIAVGDEIIVEGVPEMYKPNGRLSLKVQVIELAGEGALKKAYDELKRKLDSEGFLAPERKRMLPEFPTRIALITSEQGAAIGDFTMNLGPQGLHVKLCPSSVEGKRAVFDIIEAIRFFNFHPERYDLLVIVRGGGSFESLQAFNNETLVREVANSKIPTLLGVGHEKDVTLAALVADVMVSTPTATARTIREPFERARQTVSHAEVLLLERFERGLSRYRHALAQSGEVMASIFPRLQERFMRAQQGLLGSLERIRFLLLRADENIRESERRLEMDFSTMLSQFKQFLVRVDEKLREYDPNRALKLGYSLIRSGGHIVRSVATTKKGDTLEIRLSDGEIDAEVRKVTSNA